MEQLVKDIPKIDETKVNNELKMDSAADNVYMKEKLKKRIRGSFNSCDKQF